MARAPSKGPATWISAMLLDCFCARDPIIELGPLVVGVVLSWVVGREFRPQCVIEPVIVLG